MRYKLDWINYEAKHNPKGLIARAEANYQGHIVETVNQMIGSMKEKPIILLNGPSSSGKTTTAERIKQQFWEHGVRTEVISMDDYYLSRTEYVAPKDEEGVDDYESPRCMDLPLLHEHLERLTKGEEIAVPRFDFEKKCRTDEVELLRLEPDEVVVIEGIHALSDTITGGLEHVANGVYICLESSVQCGDITLAREQLRFIRRAIRDRNFRGASVPDTLHQWRSVRRGERLYINPYRHHARLAIDSYLPYETCILMNMLRQEIEGQHEKMDAAGLREVYLAAERFESIDYKPYLPDNSLMREFIG